MKASKKLSLKRERLTELSNDQLQGIAGGLDAAIVVARTITCYTYCTCGATQTCYTHAECGTINTCTCGCTGYQTLCCGIVEVRFAG